MLFTLLKALHEFFEDETVLRQAVKINMVELLHLTHLEVIGSFSHQQDPKLFVIEFS